MNDTTTDQKPYIVTTRKEWGRGHYILVTVTHKADCPNARFVSNPRRTDTPHGPLAPCCR